MRSKYKFIEWMDIDGSNMLSEVAILKHFPNGDIFFIPLQSLDSTDLSRLKIIISHQDAGMYEELWRLLEQRTLGNGMNALSYFNQVAKRRTAAGQIVNFNNTKVSYTPQQVQQVPQQAAQAPQAQAPQAAPEAAPFDDIVNSQNKGVKPK